MPGQYTGQMHHVETGAGREIKASAHYNYLVDGITLDGTKFAANALVVEGQCLVKDDVSGKYEPYADETEAFPAGKSDPVILDTSVKFSTFGGSTNADVIVGAAMYRGAVYESMLVGVTAAFKTAIGSAIRFV